MLSSSHDGFKKPDVDLVVPLVYTTTIMYILHGTHKDPKNMHLRTVQTVFVLISSIIPTVCNYLFSSTIGMNSANIPLT
jgi:hypothetical protein